MGGPEHYKILKEEKERIQQHPSPDPCMDAIRIAAIEAYQSHMVLDSTTTMGVPEYAWVYERLKEWRSKYL